MNLYDRINRNYNNMRPSEKKVADVLYEKFENAENVRMDSFTIDQLAMAAGVSQPTVIRFANSIGYSGFKEFKAMFVEELSRKRMDDSTGIKKISFDIDVNDSIEDIPLKVIKANIRQLECTLKSVMTDSLKRIAEAVIEAEQIVILGVENSSAVADDLAVKLAYTGFNVVFNQDSHKQIVAAANMKEGDLAIAVSFSGNTRSVVEALYTAKKSGAKTVAITNDSSSAVNRYADIRLYSGNERYLYSAGIVSRCSQLAIIDMIYTAVMLSDMERFSDVVHKRGKIADGFLLKDTEK